MNRGEWALYLIGHNVPFLLIRQVDSLDEALDWGKNFCSTLGYYVKPGDTPSFLSIMHKYLGEVHQWKISFQSYCTNRTFKYNITDLVERLAELEEKKKD